MSDEEEIALSFTYTPDSVSFVCPDCGVLLAIQRRSLASLNGTFCNCREQYTVRWNDGIVMKGTVDMGGPPSKGTPKDRRLKENKPAQPSTPTPPKPPAKPPVKKDK